MRNAIVAVAMSCTIGMGASAGATNQTDFRAQLQHLFASDGLRPSDVVTRATVTSHQLEERIDERQATQAAETQSWIGFVPRVALLARYVRLSNIVAPVIGNLVVAPTSGVGPLPGDALLVNTPVQFPVILDQTTMQATFTVPLLDYVLRIPAVHAAAKANRVAAQLSERAARLQIAVDAQLLYYAWVRAKVAAVVAAQSLEQAQQHLVAANQRFETGSGPKADLLRVQAQVAAAELVLLRTRDRASVFEEQMKTAMHANGSAPFEVGEDVRQVLPPVQRENYEALVHEAQKNRLEIHMLDAAIDVARAQHHSAMSSALPRVDAFADLFYANPNQRFFPQKDAFDFTWDVGAQLTFSPNDMASGIAGARGAAAKQRAAVAKRDSLLDSARNEVIQAATACTEADTAVITTARGLDAAEESYRVRRELYVNGRASSVEFTDAQSELTQARMDAIGARIDQRIARLQLDHAVGRDIDKVKN